MSNQQKLSKLRKEYGTGNIAIAEAFVKLLKIKPADKRYPSAIEWAVIRISSNSDLLTQRESKEFTADNNRKRVGRVHKKIIKEIEALHNINEVIDGLKPVTSSKLDQQISSRPLPVADPNKTITPEVTLESNANRVEKGGSVTLTWSSKNAVRIKRTNIPGVTSRTPVSGFIEVEDIRRRRDFYIIVESSTGKTAEAKLQTLVETQEYKKQKQKDQQLPSTEKEVDEAPKEEESQEKKVSSARRLLSPTSKPKKEEEKQDKPTSLPVASLDNNILLSIDKTLSGILKLLTNQLKLNQSIFDRDRRQAEFNIRLSKEEKMEESRGISGGDLIKKGAEQMLSPFKTIIDKIVNFIFYTFLGRAFTEIMDWMNDPKNKDKVDAIGRFLKDFWPLIAAAALYFLTPLGGFINGTVRLLSGAIKVLNALIPRMLGLSRAIITNPYLMALAAVVVGSIARIKEKERIKPLLEKQQKEIEKELKDEKTPWYKKLGLFFAQQESSQFSAESQQVLPIFPPGGMYATGGKIFSGSVTKDTGKKVSGAGRDTQAFPVMGGGMAVLQPGETVLQPGVRESIIKDKGFDVLSYNKGPNANNPKTINANVNLMNTGGIVGPKISPADYNALLAISALEDDKAQGRADVAQSLYNRMLAASRYKVNFNQTGSTLKDLITAPDQYEPTFGNTKDWLNIKDRQSAATAIMNSKKGRTHKWSLKDAMDQLNATEAALRNPVFQQQAQKHVGGRAYFLGTSQQDNMKQGDVLRGPKHNFFSPWYLEGSQYDKERRNIAAPIPPMLVQQRKEEAKPQPNIGQKIYGFVMGGIQKLIPKKKYGGLINEAQGRKLSYSQDNILMRAEKGEYVIPRIATEKIGIKVLDAISSLDPNFKIKRPQINLESPRPISKNFGAAPITLPPITQGAQVPTSSSGSGTQIPVFSATPQSGLETRSALADIYGIVG